MKFLHLTSLRTCLTSLLLLTTVCTCEGGDTAVRTWRRLSVDSRVYTMQTYSRLVTAPSHITCAHLCQTSACHVFYFRFDTGHCFLSPTLGKSNSTTSTPLTHVYFDGVTCPLNSTYLALGFISCIKPYTTRVNLPIARQTCVDNGANFVIMKTKDKMDWLINLVYRTTGITDIWLNASLIASDNRWVWFDGDTLDLKHPLWQPGKPQGGKSCLLAVYVAANNSYLYCDAICETRTNVLTAPSRITCADLCSHTSACHVFYFRSDTGHCFLSPTLGKDNSTTSTSLTHVYFDGVTCPFNKTYEVFSFTSCVKLYTTVVHNTTAYEACLAEAASVVMMKTIEKSTLLVNFVYKAT